MNWEVTWSQEWAGNDGGSISELLLLSSTLELPREVKTKNQGNQNVQVQTLYTLHVKGTLKSTAQGPAIVLYAAFNLLSFLKDIIFYFTR